MAKFIMLGRYSVDAIKGISASRTKKVISIIESSSGKVDSIYALLGNYDLALIVEFDDISKAIGASVAITKLTGIGFNTLPAISVEDFDKIASK